MCLLWQLFLICGLKLIRKLCDRVLLDSWHAAKHKCDKAQVDPKHLANESLVTGCNTEVVEQCPVPTSSRGFATISAEEHFACS